MLAVLIVGCDVRETHGACQHGELTIMFELWLEAAVDPKLSASGIKEVHQLLGGLRSTQQLLPHSSLLLSDVPSMIRYRPMHRRRLLTAFPPAKDDSLVSCGTAC